jgi:hypothetical protein
VHLPRSLALLHPTTWKPAFQATRTLWFDYAHLRSVLHRSCVDAGQQPIPWYTYPAIEYLKQLDFSEARVFEYGSGNSTLFWAAAARQVVSVEDDPGWYQKIRQALPSNCELTLETDLTRYVEAIHVAGGEFDVIVVDGAARGGTRRRCALAALGHLRRGGMIILDNSDWLPESTKLLRDADLIQIDMTGFIPIGGQTQTTSLFLHREFKVAPRGARQPMPGPGAAAYVWEHPRSVHGPLVEIDGEAFGGVARREDFELVSPAGPRRFTFLVGANGPEDQGYAAILDRDQQRVLISLSDDDPRAPWAVSQLEPALHLPWDRFCAFIEANDKKRYSLIETFVAAPG